MCEKERKRALMIAAESGYDWRTVLRWLQGKPVKRGTAASLKLAAKKLEIEPAQAKAS